MKQFDTYKVLGTLVFLSLWCSTGCKKTVVSADSEPVVVSFSLKASKESPKSGVSSKATGNDEFLSSSMLGMFAGESRLTSVAGLQYSNVGYENPTGSTEWKVPEGAEPIYFPLNDAAMDFYAYHPYSKQTTTSTSFVSGNTWIDYTLPSMQSTTADLKNADLLWGSAVDRTQKQETVTIDFYHKLSKLSLTIMKGSDWGADNLSLSAIKVSGNNVLKEAQLDLLSGALRPTVGGSTSIECALSPSQSLSVLNEFKCDFIMIPAPAQDIVLTFVHENGTGQSLATLTSGLTLKSGTQLNVRVTINKFSPTELSVAPTMAAWNFVSEVEIEGI